jgi:voltage-gated potassium channel
MFILAMLFLVLLAAVIHRGQELETTQWGTYEAWILLGGLAVLWPVFLVESVVRFFLAPRDRRTWKTAAYLLATGLFPPLRLAGRSVTRPNHLWLPWMGWQEVNFDLQKTLERVFSGPMFFMAFLILPVLAVEYFWSEAIEASPALRVFLAIGVGLIWIAFTVEFIIRISAAERKLGYAFNHWVDLAVVVLPTLEFLPFLRILRATRLMRLDTLARFGKYYRLYGLAGKGWRGLVTLQLIRGLFSRKPEARITWFKSQLESKEEEMRELKRELDYYRRRIEALQAEGKSRLQEEKPPRPE